jgi:hypothetical protein
MYDRKVGSEPFGARGVKDEDAVIRDDGAYLAHDALLPLRHKPRVLVHNHVPPALTHAAVSQHSASPQIPGISNNRLLRPGLQAIVGDSKGICDLGHGPGEKGGEFRPRGLMFRSV